MTKVGRHSLERQLGKRNSDVGFVALVNCQKYLAQSREFMIAKKIRHGGVFRTRGLQIPHSELSL